MDLTETVFEVLDVTPDLNSLAVIEDDSPNDSRGTDFSGDWSTGNTINAETKDVKEKVTGGDANELETQIDSKSVNENEIGTNTAIVLDSPVTFILQHCTPSENPQNLQSNDMRRPLDSDVPTSNWSPWDSRPSTSSPNSMPRHNSLESVTVTNSNSRSAEDKAFPCGVCNKSYTRKHDRTRHVWHNHPESVTTTNSNGQSAQDPIYPCDICNKSFTRNHNRTRHMWHNHRESVTTTNSNSRSAQEQTFPCDMCNKSFTHKHDRARHMLTHTGDNPHTCPEGGQEFSRFDTMTQRTKHTRTHSRDDVLGSSSSLSSSGASPAEPACRELPEAPRPARPGYESIRLLDQIAPQVDQDEMSPPDHDGKTIAPRYHPYLRKDIQPKE